MRKLIDKSLELVIATLLIAMVLDVLYGVVTRYVFSNQSEWTDELARYLMIWVSILGAAYASGKNLHISIDILPQYLSAHGKRWLNIFISSIIILFVTLVFIVGGIRYTYISFHLGQISPALKIPVGYIYLIMPVSGFLIFYYRTQTLLQTLKSKPES